MSDKLKEKLRSIIIDITEVDEIPDDAAFSDLNIDSMMAIEVVADVEKEYDITISEEEIVDLTNLQALYEKVQEKLAEKS